MGGRGSSSNLPESDGPRGGGGGDNDILWNQPNTPQMRPPAPTIEGQLGKKGEAISAWEAATKVNPYREIEYGDYSMNCQRCVVAYELNRRGYKVEAEATYEKDPYPKRDKWATAFKGGKLENVGGRTTASINKKIEKLMSGWKNGSRAVVKVAYNSKEGHVFNVEYRNGKLSYYDAQTGNTYNNKTVFNYVKKDSVKIMRTDNLELSSNVKDMVRKRK